MGNLCGSGLSPEQAAENAARRSPSAAADDVKSVKDDYVLAQQIGEVRARLPIDIPARSWHLPKTQCEGG